MKTLKERIEKKTTKQGKHILWNGYVRASGVPFIFSGDKKRGSVSVAKALWEDKYGKPRSNIYNQCGILNCVNPDHYKSGQRTRNKQLCDLEVEEIRNAWALHLRHNTTMDKLGKKYGVTRQAIECVVNLKTHR